MMICSRCQKEIPDDAIICCYCGCHIIKVRKKTSRSANGSGYIFKRGKTWTVRMTAGWKTAEDGHRIQVLQYKGGFPTRQAAQEYVYEIKKNPPSKEPPTYEELYNEWREHHINTRKVGKSAINGYRTAFNHLESIKHLKITEITPAKLQAILNEEGMSHRMKKQISVVLKMTFEYAVDEYDLEKSPVRNLYYGPDDSEPIEPLTEEELELIRQHFDDEPFAKYVYCMAYLGYRPTAFFSLKKSDYHDENGAKYFIGGIKTDAGKNRIVTIPPKIQPLIEERLAVEGTELVFPRYYYTRRKPPTFDHFGVMSHAHFSEKIFKPMMKRLGITDRVPYSTRHTYSNKIKGIEGADRDKADLMGHSSYELTKKVYQTTSIEDRKKITDKLE